MATPVLGVDPGKGGGFAFIDPGGMAAGALKIPTILDGSDVDYAQLEAYWADLRLSGVEHAYVESLVKYAGKNQTGSSAIVYGYNAGAIRGILEAQKWQIHPIIPIQWQRYFTKSKTSDFKSRAEWKNHLKDIAQTYFPYLNITLAISDALLIAKYGYEIRSKTN